MQEHAEQQRSNLRNQHEKQRRELEIKLKEMEDKLIIRMKKEFEILRKKNNLHEIEIRRLQGLEKKWASNKGTSEPELKRTKKLKKQRNEILEEYKKSMFGNTQNGFEDSVTEEERPKGKFNAKTLLGQTMKFGITHQSDSQPINSKTLKAEGSMGNRIDKYIGPGSKEKGYSLTQLYDNELRVQDKPTILTQDQKQSEKNRKFEFMMSKLSH